MTLINNCVGSFLGFVGLIQTLAKGLELLGVVAITLSMIGLLWLTVKEVRKL